MLACEEDHVAVAEYLIAQGADVNIKNNVRYNMMVDA
jgi:ankyrin repeat protein